MARFGLLTMAAAALLASGCAEDRDYNYENGGSAADPGFDDDGVVHAGDGPACAVVPEAQDCVAEHPASFLPANSTTVELICDDLGYDCCDPGLYISEDAARCIADNDPRYRGTIDQMTLLTCDHDFDGPMYGIWEGVESNSVQGLGVHAVTGTLTWYNDGAGVV